ncbi:hypothetical protein [Ilumatobacter coccineus]|uniref:Uncharacterized protein n=1 Tax=Ilumatobacter coccineus (strain NBRC 103263 / KCTC 29153 / YM16-304) TaxID=1313172 RepID=A0A6C7E4T5_ILUCY|nr:hypothetical protein [Ilumatobacter coccineus]BAN02834.1 hypothetical protein YM304_25200 [Ilumatobacter coccineus YM16-304]
MRPFPDPSDSTTSRPGVDDRTVDDDLTVSMFGEHLVICPPERLDLETTEVLVVAAASAVAAGSTVMIDLDPDTASDELIARRPLSTTVPPCIGDDGGAVVVIGAGMVRLAARDVVWTLDLDNGRMYRSDEAIDPYFVRPGDWTALQALWVSPTHVNALTVDGRHLSALAAWTLPHAGRPAVPA